MWSDHYLFFHFAILYCHIGPKSENQIRKWCVFDYQKSFICHTAEIFSKISKSTPPHLAYMIYLINFILSYLQFYLVCQHKQKLALLSWLIVAALIVFFLFVQNEVLSHVSQNIASVRNKFIPDLMPSKKPAGLKLPKNQTADYWVLLSIFLWW